MVSGYERVPPYISSFPGSFGCLPYSPPSLAFSGWNGGFSSVVCFLLFFPALSSTFQGPPFLFVLYGLAIAGIEEGIPSWGCGF